MGTAAVKIAQNLKVRKTKNVAFAFIGMLALMFALLTLILLILDLAKTGVPRLSLAFLTSFASPDPAEAGIVAAWVGSFAVMVTTAICAIPLGVGAGIYLEEYAPKNIVTGLIELSIVNLAGVPSITFGLMAMGLFVQRFGFGQSIMTAGLTLGLLVLPIIIVTTRESIRAVPSTIREAAYGLGASQWQVLSHHVLQYSQGGIMTGVIIALSRAIGETAPLITVGALTFIPFLPHSPISSEPPFINFSWLWDPFTVMPMQMFSWISRPQHEFHENAAAAGIVLLAMTLAMNAIAIFLRYRFRRSVNW